MSKTVEMEPSGFIKNYPASDQERPIQWGIGCIWVAQHFVIYDVPPWGLILPAYGMMEDMVAYFFDIDSWEMPKGTMVGVRWTPHGGSDTHITTQQVHEGEDPYTRIRIPEFWVTSYIDRDVLVECEVSYPDGSVEIAPSFNLHVAKHVEHNGATIGDLSYGGVLDPSKYPDGIPVTIPPIGNVEPYQNVRMYMEIYGKNAGEGQDTLNLWGIDFPGETDKTYEFMVPPEAYASFNDPSYDEIIVWMTISVKLVPAQIPQFAYGIERLRLTMVPAKGE